MFERLLQKSFMLCRLLRFIDCLSSSCWIKSRRWVSHRELFGFGADPLLCHTSFSRAGHVNSGFHAISYSPLPVPSTPTNPQHAAKCLPPTQASKLWRANMCWPRKFQLKIKHGRYVLEYLYSCCMDSVGKRGVEQGKSTSPYSVQTKSQNREHWLTCPPQKWGAP